MRRLLPLLLAGGCGTVVPMQTASVVEPGHLRIGGQASGGYCDTGNSFRCNIYPDGVPLPALRVDGRKGMGRRSDVGGSVGLQGMIYAPERPLQLGITADGKRELLRSSGDGGITHLLSGGVLVGGAVAGRLGLAPWLQTEVGVPLHYGLQTEHHEWVASAWTAYRALFASVGGDQDLPAFNSLRYGVALGVYRRAPAGWGVSVGYDTSTDPFLGGAVQAQLAWFWDR